MLPPTGSSPPLGMDDRGGGWEEQQEPYEEEGDRGEKTAAATAEDAKAAAAVGKTQPESNEKAAEHEVETAVKLDSDWIFIDMETVSLHDLPHALIACNLPLAVFFADGPCRVGEPTGKASGWGKEGWRRSCLAFRVRRWAGGRSCVRACLCLGLSARQRTDRSGREEDRGLERAAERQA